MHMDIIIVDKEDKEVGVKTITEVDWARDMYRVGAMLLYNKKNEILLAQRSFDKEHSPGMWGPSAAGIVEAGESYKENAIKETEEEIGFVTNPDVLVTGPKFLISRDDPVRTYFLQWHFYPCDGAADSFVLQEDEVEAVKWISIDTFKENPDAYMDMSPELLEYLP